MKHDKIEKTTKFNVLIDCVAEKLTLGADLFCSMMYVDSARMSQTVAGALNKLQWIRWD